MRGKKFIPIIFFFVALILFPSATVKAERSVYTYTYDYWEVERESPDAYSVQETVTGSKLGIGDFNNPQGLYVRDNRIYVCDTGNHRIVVLERDGNNNIEVIDQIYEFSGDVELNTFSQPHDIFVTETGELYIADTNNQRVLHLSSDYKLIKVITRPTDETVDKAADFLPTKLVADKAGRCFVLARNFNKGYLQYDRDGLFIGYMGASEVRFNLTDYIWKLLSTQKQKSQMAQFVPTEYNNVAMDKDGFLYATNAIFEEYQLRNDEAKPIRKLNSMGTDILVKNGYLPPIGDQWWDTAGGVSGSSRLIDITVLDNDIYYAIDRTRGRIFGYDDQGNLLYAFGSLGNKLGYQQFPTALEHMGTDLLVLDSRNLGITFYTLTEYGKLINDAIKAYSLGQYDLSADYWREVLRLNGNYDMAYIGIGRSLLRQERYKEAMEYFEFALDRMNYCKAFQLYRKEWIEENIAWIFTSFFLIITVPIVIGKIKKIRREVGVE